MNSGMPAHALLALFKYIMTLDLVAPLLTLSLLNAASEKILPSPQCYYTSNLLRPEEIQEKVAGEGSQGGNKRLMVR